ncbi:MAG: hypothetical protein M1831_004907 [Alyxoria varia]|nr:MAG: hypothetical protein M1831_004907 [Alyxoria varia]
MPSTNNLVTLSLLLLTPSALALHDLLPGQSFTLNTLAPRDTDLTKRADCETYSGYKSCGADATCIFTSSKCCPGGFGCAPGTYCTRTACCPDGETCERGATATGGGDDDAPDDSGDDAPDADEGNEGDSNEDQEPIRPSAPQAPITSPTAPASVIASAAPAPESSAAAPSAEGSAAPEGTSSETSTGDEEPSETSDSSQPAATYTGAASSTSLKFGWSSLESGSVLMALAGLTAGAAFFI